MNPLIFMNSWDFGNDITHQQGHKHKGHVSTRFCNGQRRKTLQFVCVKSWRLHMRNYFGTFYFGEFKS